MLPVDFKPFANELSRVQRIERRIMPGWQTKPVEEVEKIAKPTNVPSRAEELPVPDEFHLVDVMA